MRRSRRNLPNLLTPEEVDRLVDAAAAGRGDGARRNPLMMRFLYSTGLRVSELVALGLHDVVHGQRDIRVRNGKGGVDRTVPYPPSLDPILSAWESMRDSALWKKRRNTAYYWCTLGHRLGQPLTIRCVQRAVERARQRANLHHCTPHTLRHSFASRFLESGGSIAEAQLLLGHADLSTTAIYLHANPKLLRDRVAMLDQASPRAKLTAAISQLDESAVQALLGALREATP